MSQVFVRGVEINANLLNARTLTRVCRYCVCSCNEPRNEPQICPDCNGVNIPNTDEMDILLNDLDESYHCQVCNHYQGYAQCQCFRCLPTPSLPSFVFNQSNADPSIANENEVQMNDVNHENNNNIDINNAEDETSSEYSNSREETGTRTIRLVNMNIEKDRFATFYSWSNPFIDPDVLAYYGFYVIMPPNKIQCYSCNIKVMIDLKGDIGNCNDKVYSYHKMKSPNCPLINNAPDNRNKNLENIEFHQIVPKYPRQLLRTICSDIRCAFRLKRFEEKLECKLCFVNDVEIILEPCKHIVFCSYCSKKIKKCPVCRIDITSRSRAFF